LAAGLAAVVLASEALAASEDEKEQARLKPRAAKILAHMDEARIEDQSWLESHVRIRKGIGVVYYRKVKNGDRDLVLSVGGPTLKRKRWGLMFEVRF
jgi:hypothetical protein